MQFEWFFDGEVSIHTPIQGVTTLMPGRFLPIGFQSTHPYRV